jgi:hypothetical protein
LQRGGRHSLMLDRYCTHLVTTSDSSDKYLFALKEGICCVLPAWLEACFGVGVCVDEKPYLLKPQGGGAIQNLARSGSIQVRATDTSARQAAAAVWDGNTQQQQRQLQQQKQQTTDPSVRRDFDAANHADGGASSDPAQSQLAFDDARALASDLPAAPMYNDLDWDDATPTFLDSCRVWLVGCTPAERQEALLVLRRGAGKRFADPVEDLTHVVVGGAISGAEAAEVSE